MAGGMSALRHQTATPRPAGTRPPVAAVLVAVVLACGGGGCASARPATVLADYVSASYDPAADTTRVRTTLMPVAGNVQMYAGFSFAGEVLTAPPPRVRIVFQETSAGARWQDPRGRSLVLRVDDTARVVVAETQYRRHTLAGRGPLTARVTEWVWASVPAETFERIASATRVEGTIGATRFALKPQQLTVLRQLTQRFAPRSTTSTP